MGTRGGGDGNWPPDGGKPEGLPGLPPEWGPIVIPDDASALAEEAARVRRQLRLESRHRRFRRRLDRLTGGGRGRMAALRVPLMVMTLAISAAMVSLFALAWPGTGRHSAIPTDRTVRTAPVPGGQTVPALDLLDPDGRPVSLRGLLPAAILFTDDCPCAELIAGTARNAPAGVVVLLVARRPPEYQLPADVAQRVHPVGDPAGTLRASLSMPSAGADQASTARSGPAAPPSALGRADVLLVEGGGAVLGAYAGVAGVDVFRNDLARLAPATAGPATSGVAAITPGAASVGH